MPSDIRSFFGGKTSTPIRQKETTKADDSKKKRQSNMGRSSHVVGMLYANLHKRPQDH